MTVISRRRYALASLVTIVLIWAVITSSFWTGKEMAIQSGDGPLIINIADVNYRRTSVVEADPETILSQEMELRKRRLAGACRELKSRPKRPYERIYDGEGPVHLIYNQRKQVMYCYLPKVANTNFRRVFFGLEGVITPEKVPELSGYEVYFIMKDKLKYLTGMNPAGRAQVMSQYKKFMVVRDPLERLLSGYRNKFFHPNPTHQAEYHTKYVEFYKQHPSLRAVRTIRNNFTVQPVSFNEFLIYFADNFETATYLNEHFVPAYLLCHPCDVEFDYIGKYESINQDAGFIFDKLNIDVPFPGRNDNYSAVSTSEVAKTYYDPVSPEVLRRVIPILEPDYRMFGYTLPDWVIRKIS